VHGICESILVEKEVIYSCPHSSDTIQMQEMHSKSVHNQMFSSKIKTLSQSTGNGRFPYYPKSRTECEIKDKLFTT